VLHPTSLDPAAARSEEKGTTQEAKGGQEKPWRPWKTETKNKGRKKKALTETPNSARHLAAVYRSWLSLHPLPPSSHDPPLEAVKVTRGPRSAIDPVTFISPRRPSNPRQAPVPYHFSVGSPFDDSRDNYRAETSPLCLLLDPREHPVPPSGRLGLDGPGLSDRTGRLDGDGVGITALASNTGIHIHIQAQSSCPRSSQTESAFQ
jgi:hypothetical protein